MGRTVEVDECVALWLLFQVSRYLVDGLQTIGMIRVEYLTRRTKQMDAFDFWKCVKGRRRERCQRRRTATMTETCLWSSSISVSKMEKIFFCRPKRPLDWTTDPICPDDGTERSFRHARLFRFRAECPQRDELRTRRERDDFTDRGPRIDSHSHAASSPLIPDSERVLGVGSTFRATAMFTSQAAWELGMRGYDSAVMNCTIQYVDDTGQTRLKETRTQLGIEATDCMTISGLKMISEIIKAHKMDIKFDTAAGWRQLRALNVVDNIRWIISEETFSSVLVRDDSMSVTVLIHTRYLSSLIRNSGQGSIFNKLHADDPKSQDSQLVFLPSDTVLTTALQNSKILADTTYDVRRKASVVLPRFAIRMKDGESMMKLVEELGLTEEMKCGRYKLMGVSAEAGSPG